MDTQKLFIVRIQMKHFFATLAVSRLLINTNRKRKVIKGFGQKRNSSSIRVAYTQVLRHLL